MHTFRIINITPLFVAHRTEMTADLLRLHKECGVTDVAFMLPLHPEGRVPSLAKAERLRDLFREMRQELAGSGLRVGILIQSTMGHGTVSESAFTRSVNAKGMTTASVCPLAPGFADYLRRAVATVAATRPEFLLVDDDFRLANHGAAGCYCAHHLAVLEQATGRHFERDGLEVALKTDGTLQQQWDAVRLESLLALAREIRAGIDATDSKLPCGFCICDAGGMELQYAHAIEAVLAGGNPPFVRVNSAWYSSSDTKGLVQRIYWTSAQTRTMKDMPEILGESDTYPQNRYYTPARALNAQILFSILHGCNGLKLWVSRMGEFQPESGEAYRQMLKANIAAYQKLADLMPQVAWLGPTTPLPADPAKFPPYTNPVRSENWACAVLAHLGIPVTVGANADSPVVMLTGPECDFFSDDELRAFLARGVLLDGSAAQRFCDRGLGGLLGVAADLPRDWQCTFERLNGHAANGAGVGKDIILTALVSGTAVRLTPNAPATQTLSTLYHIPFFMSGDETVVGAGLTLHENALGGRVAVYAARADATAFLDEVRRGQLIHVLDWLNRTPLPAIVLSDLDIYALHGRVADPAGGGELLVLFNLNLDPLPEIRLRTGGRTPVTIERLAGSGRWLRLKWVASRASPITVQAKLETAVPLILKIQFSK
ncbi:MAG: hypothetical protein WC708_11910 [Lentisphaeria bacterium]